MLELASDNMLSFGWLSSGDDSLAVRSALTLRCEGKVDSTGARRVLRIPPGILFWSRRPPTLYAEFPERIGVDGRPGVEGETISSLLLCAGITGGAGGSNRPNSEEGAASLESGCSCPGSPSIAVLTAAGMVRGGVAVDHRGVVEPFWPHK